MFSVVARKASHVVESKLCDGPRVTERRFLQVVLVGAGMDTRAWRLKLAQGVSWFEVDQQHVLDAKLSILKGAGAQLSHLRDDSTISHRLACASHHPVGAALQCMTTGHTGAFVLICRIHLSSFSKLLGSLEAPCAMHRLTTIYCCYNGASSLSSMLSCGDFCSSGCEHRHTHHCPQVFRL
jgi:Leucine carboxyl methyltransferase